MRDAYLVGAAQTEFGAFPRESYRPLFAEAFTRATESVDGELEKDEIDEAFVGNLGIGGRQIGLAGPAVTEHVGLDGTPCTRVENACAASGSALRHAVTAVRAGTADVALAGGYEVMTDMSDERTRRWLGISGETEWERMAGTTFAGVYALMADAHMGKHGTTREQLSHVAVKNHSNGRKIRRRTLVSSVLLTTPSVPRRSPTRSTSMTAVRLPTARASHSSPRAAPPKTSQKRRYVSQGRDRRVRTSVSFGDLRLPRYPRRAKPPRRRTGTPMLRPTTSTSPRFTTASASRRYSRTRT